MYLFFDTETTGVPRDYKASISNIENWPRMIQLGYIVMDGDKIVHEHETIIKPDGFEIPIQASSIHGITTEKALHDGAELVSVLDEFGMWVGNCDTIIGHNVSFGVNIIGAEYFRLYGKSPLEGKKTIDTMESSKAYVGIRNSYGFKWPKLAELYRKLFNEDMGAAHTALQDIQNTVKCYFELERLGVIKQTVLE
jgi:DNA polymerase III epsilon subunit-like protein